METNYEIDSTQNGVASHSAVTLIFNGSYIPSVFAALTLC